MVVLKAVKVKECATDVKQNCTGKCGAALMACMKTHLGNASGPCQEVLAGAAASQKLSPNLDFSSAITLRALGFPTEMFTVLYAIGHTAGWIAHWKEMIDDPSQRIGRPRQLYTGATERTYVPMELRSSASSCSKIFSRASALSVK